MIFVWNHWTYWLERTSSFQVTIALIHSTAYKVLNLKTTLHKPWNDLKCPTHLLIPHLFPSPPSLKWILNLLQVTVVSHFFRANSAARATFGPLRSLCGRSWRLPANNPSRTWVTRRSSTTLATSSKAMKNRWEIALYLQYLKMFCFK